MQITSRLLATNGGGQPGGGREPVFQLTPPQGLPTDICVLLNNLTDFAIQLSIVIAPFFVLWAAWLFISSAGNEQQITTARKIILYVVIGLAIVFLARGLVFVIQDVLGVGVSGLCGGPTTPAIPGTGGPKLQ